MKYKVGDKVRVRKDLAEKEYPMEDEQYGHVAVSYMCELRGKVVTISNAMRTGYFIKESGYYWTDEMFEGLANEKKILITSDGTEMLARLYVDGKVVKRATAKCSPEDKFDFNVGAKLAFERLCEPELEKKEEYYNGKVVCVSNENNPQIYTVGKIYQFVDGKFTDDNGADMPQLCKIKDFKQWQKYTSSKFIEIKE